MEPTTPDLVRIVTNLRRRPSRCRRTSKRRTKRRSVLLSRRGSGPRTTRIRSHPLRHDAGRWLGSILTPTAGSTTQERRRLGRARRPVRRRAAFEAVLRIPAQRCKTVVVENRYIDADFRSDYSAFWSKRFDSLRRSHDASISSRRISWTGNSMIYPPRPAISATASSSQGHTRMAGSVAQCSCRPPTPKRHDGLR